MVKRSNASDQEVIPPGYPPHAEVKCAYRLVSATTGRNSRMKLLPNGTRGDRNGNAIRQTKTYANWRHMFKSRMRHSTTYLSPFLAPTPHAFKRSGVDASVLSDAFTSRTFGKRRWPVKVPTAGTPLSAGKANGDGWANSWERADLGREGLCLRVCV